MLADPLTIKSLSLSAHSAITVIETNSFATIDAGAGRSVRSCAAPTLAGVSLDQPAVLTIAHSVSNENKPGKTDRHLVRLDYVFRDATGDQDLKAYAYAVVGVPRGGIFVGGEQQSTPLMALALVQNLIGVLGVNSSSAALDETKVNRILTGEP